ncbi:MAG: branched-chain amino acid ABC transporter permease [Streptosporangiaceae bacterium]
MNTVELIAILALFASGTNLVLGQAGLLTFGQAAFFGEGAYTFGLLAEHGISLWVAAAAAVGLGGVTALVVGVVLLRTRKLYFALASLVVSQLAYTFAVTQYGLTGGNNGLYTVTLPAFLTNTTESAWLVCAVAAAGVACLIAIQSSRFGLMLEAIRDNRPRVASLGAHPAGYEEAAFGVSGAFCALAGVLQFIHDGGVAPQLLNWQESAIPVLAAVIGGMYSLAGPVLGAALYEIVYTTAVSGSANWEIIFGAVLIAVVLLAPYGLAGIPGQLGRLMRRRRAEWVHLLRWRSP